jgi:hypothetical protein
VAQGFQATVRHSSKVFFLSKAKDFSTSSHNHRNDDRATEASTADCCKDESCGYSVERVGGIAFAARSRAILLTAASSIDAKRPRSRSENAGGPLVIIPIERR